jgi:hypothetical protein
LTIDPSGRLYRLLPEFSGLKKLVVGKNEAFHPSPLLKRVNDFLHIIQRDPAIEVSSWFDKDHWPYPTGIQAAD